MSESTSDARPAVETVAPALPSDRPDRSKPPARRPGREWAAALPRDLLAGVTVALVAVPQCIGFALIAGLPPEMGLYSAVAMGLVSAAVSRSPRLMVGPAIAASTMLLALLRTVEPHHPERWPAIAGVVAVLVGLMTLVAAALNVGRAVRFVSRSVIVGLVIASAMLTIGSQLGPLLGVPGGRQPMLIGILWHALRTVGDINPAAVVMAVGTFLVVMLGGRFHPRLPWAFLAMSLSVIVAWIVERVGRADLFEALGRFEWRWSPAPPSLSAAGHGSDLLVGAAAICLVGIIQNLTIAKAFTLRADEPLRPKRELWALGLSNIAAGVFHGLPGSGSFARSALADLAGARTRMTGVVAAVATALIAVLGAPLAKYITLPAIAGLLIATALSMVDWKELRLLLRDRDDRLVLLTLLATVLFLPIYWAVLIALALSVALFLRHASRLYLFEMVRRPDGSFGEQEIDEQTGESDITMLQIEGPLFFAHADDIAAKLRTVFERGPRVVVIRMRRTQQIDYSVIAATHRVMREFRVRGGHVILCGLTRGMRLLLLRSPLGELLGRDRLLLTTRAVFGSAHRAIADAEALVERLGDRSRPRFRLRARTADASGIAER